MDIDGVERFWVKAVIGRDGTVTKTLAVLTRMPLTPIEPGHDPEAARRLLAALREVQERHGIDSVEVVANPGG